MADNQKAAPESVASLPFRTALEGIIARLRDFMDRALACGQQVAPEGEEREDWLLQHREAALALVGSIHSEVDAGRRQMELWAQMLAGLNPRHAQNEGEVFIHFHPAGEPTEDFLQRAIHRALDMRRNVATEEERGSNFGSRAPSQLSLRPNEGKGGHSRIDFRPVVTSTPRLDPINPPNPGEGEGPLVSPVHPSAHSQMNPSTANFGALQIVPANPRAPLGPGVNPPAFQPSPQVFSGCTVNQQAPPQQPPRFSRAFNPNPVGPNSGGNFRRPFPPPRSTRFHSPHSSHSSSPEARASPQQRRPRSNAARATVQLPKMRLQEFSGEPGTWSQFWQVFSFAVDSNRELPDQLKLSYLLGQLAKGSPAQRAISGYECSGENYPLVLATLRQRFGDNRRQADLLLDQLLESPRIPDNSTALRSFVDLVDRNCRQLERGGLLQDGIALLRALKTKLPVAVLTELCKSERRSGQVWDLADWRRELNELITEREEIERVTRRPQGESKLPIKSGTDSRAPPRPPLPHNFHLAHGRLRSVIKRLQTQPGLLAKYDAVFQEQEKLGILEPASCRFLDPPSAPNPDAGLPQEELPLEHYLPHHPVITHKLRIVLDPTAGHPSLNDCFLKGPNLLVDLAGIVVRLRLSRVPVIADIKQAFLQLWLREADRELVKILWVRDLDAPVDKANLVAKRYTRVVFGAKPSPFILIGTLRLHCEQSTRPIAPLVARNTFMDDAALLAESTGEAKEKVAQARALLDDAGMELRGFASPNPEALEGIPEEDRVQTDLHKFLGIRWNLPSDEFIIPFPSTPRGTPLSRRVMASTYHSLYDVLGLCAPSALLAKIQFQEVWAEKGNWDTPVSSEAVSKWEKLMSTWEGAELRFPRLISLEGVSALQLHIFCDASGVAAAAAAYLRVQTPQQTRAFLIFSKNKVKEVKVPATLTINRMELIGILLGVRLRALLADYLDTPLGKSFIWSDSRIALSWVASRKEMPLWVENRVTEIRRHSPHCVFRHLPGSENPAEATRGLTPAQLVQSRLWWNGPKWLPLPEENWPETAPFSPPDNEENAGEEFEEMPNGEEVSALFVAGPPWLPTHPLPFLNPVRFSTLRSLQVRLMAWMRCLRHHFNPLGINEAFALHRLRPEIAAFSPRGPITNQDWQLSLRLLIRWEQSLKGLLDIPRLHQPFIRRGEDGLYRLVTRLAQEVDEQGIACPVVLPPNSPLVPLLIMDCHDSIHHFRIEFTTAKFLGQYWTPDARRRVTTALAACSHCQREKNRKFALPPFPPLPLDRIERRAPFQVVGLDLLGPTAVRLPGQQERVKIWVALFTCFSTRAVHLEPILSLSGHAFLCCFREFVATRRRPVRILSDNGTNFVAVARAIASQPNSGIWWEFIPPASPWSGGVYERLVGLVKSAFRRTLGRQVLDWVEFRPFLKEVEATLNCRPLTLVSDKADGLLPLRPVDFIRPHADWALNAPSLDELFNPRDPQEKLRQIWAASMVSADRFWERWRVEYLLMLRGRHQRLHKAPRLISHREPLIGEVVIVEEGTQRNLWPLARVEGLEGAPGRIRTAQLRMANGRRTSRPISKLVPLELSPLHPAIPLPIEGPQIDEELSENREFPPQASLAEEGEKGASPQPPAPENDPELPPSPPSVSLGHR